MENQTNQNLSAKDISYVLWSFIISLIVFSFFVYELLTKGFFINWDAIVNLSIVGIQNSFFVSLSNIIAILFDGAVSTIYFLFLIALLWFKKLKKDAIFVIVSVVLDGGFIYLFKNLFHRMRPANMIANETSFSFPSGHSVNAVVLFGVIIYLSWKYLKSRVSKIIITVISVLMILIIGFSRVCLNVHWLSDVLGGYFLGIMILCISFFVLYLIDKK